LRALILVAGAALAVSACSSNDAANNTMNVDENLTTDMNTMDMNATDMNATMDMNAATDAANSADAANNAADAANAAATNAQ
jgi:hypothetical protein